MEVIWDLALSSTSRSIQEQSSNFLLQLYKKVNPKVLEKEALALSQDFLRRSMGNVEKGIAEFRKTKSSERILRALDMLWKQISSLEKSYEIIAKGEDASDIADIPEFTMSIKASMEDTKNESKPIELEVKSNMKVKDLLIHIFKVLNLNYKIDHCLFIYNGTVILSKRRFATTLYEAGIGDDGYIQIRYTGIDQPALLIDQQMISDIEYDYPFLEEAVPGKSRQVYRAALRRSQGNKEFAMQFLLEESKLKQILREADCVENHEACREYIKQGGSLSTIFSKEQKYFDLIIECLQLDSPEISSTAWNFLNSLNITNANILKLLSGEFSNEESKKQWTNLLDQQKNLMLIAYVMEKYFVLLRQWKEEGAKGQINMNDSILKYISYGAFNMMQSQFEIIAKKICNPSSQKTNPRQLKVLIKLASQIIALQKEIMKSAFIRNKGVIECIRYLNSSNFEDSTSPHSVKNIGLVKAKSSNVADGKINLGLELKEDFQKYISSVITNSISDISSLITLIKEIPFMQSNSKERLLLLDEVFEYFALLLAAFPALFKRICDPDDDQTGEAICTILAKCNEKEIRRTVLKYIILICNLFTDVAPEGASGGVGEILLFHPKTYYLNSFTVLHPCIDAKSTNASCEEYFRLFEYLTGIYM